jgi:hypothetical protein
MRVSLLRVAIERGSLEAVVSALDSGADIEEADQHGHSGLPLRLACFFGHVAIVRELIERGANIFAPNAEGPEAPLRIAARRNHQEIVDLLLRSVSDLSLDTLSSEDPAERRKKGDRRKVNVGPPKGMKDRRVAERRSTRVQEVELSDVEWEAFFVARKTVVVDKEQERAHFVLEKVRD